MASNCEISQESVCVYVYTFILKIFMQMPEDDLRVPKHAACLKLYEISSCVGWKYDCSFVGYTSAAYKPTWYT
jgi:hypothetical protein